MLKLKGSRGYTLRTSQMTEVRQDGTEDRRRRQSIRDDATPGTVRNPGARQRNLHAIRRRRPLRYPPAQRRERPIDQGYLQQQPAA